MNTKMHLIFVVFVLPLVLPMFLFPFPLRPPRRPITR